MGVHPEQRVVHLWMGSRKGLSCEWEPGETSAVNGSQGRPQLWMGTRGGLSCEWEPGEASAVNDEQGGTQLLNAKQGKGANAVVRPPRVAEPPAAPS